MYDVNGGVTKTRGEVVSTTLLTDGRSRYTGLRWSRSGALYAYSSTERKGRSWDSHVRAPGEPARSGRHVAEAIGE